MGVEFKIKGHLVGFAFGVWFLVAFIFGGENV